MPLLWFHSSAGSWVPSPLVSARVQLGDRATVFCPPVSGSISDAKCFVLASPRAGVSLNGGPLATGIRVLRDRDEIVFGGSRCFFSTERLARVEPFPGAADKVFCARCRQAMEQDFAAVRCPGCGTWCHQREDLGCWTYGPKCPLCDQATALDAGYRWQPEF